MKKITNPFFVMMINKDITRSYPLQDQWASMPFFKTYKDAYHAAQAFVMHREIHFNIFQLRTEGEEDKNIS